jgi:hypothetical protein
LAELPWDVAQDELGVKGADFIAIIGKVILLAKKDEIRAQLPDFMEKTEQVRRQAAKDQ